MDVGILRPGTIPIAPESVLWFEFLLDENILLEHLQKQNPDPKPIELITKFTTAIYDSLKNQIRRTEVENNETGIVVELDTPLKYSLKNFALKILSLKVAAYIKWDLSMLRDLPFKIQISLLQDLLYFTNDETWIEIPNITDCTSNISQAHLFALVIYHRWFLGTCMHRVLSKMDNKIINGEGITPLDENIICTQDNIDKSLEFLNDALSWDTIPGLLSIDCFVMLTEKNSETQMEWERSIVISKEEFRAQLHYDLAIYYFYNENYDIGENHFNNCSDYLKSMRGIQTGFLSINQNILDGYILACNNERKDMKPSLAQQFCNSIAKHYNGILTILISDNVSREIPLAHRLNLELDIQGAQSSGKFTIARDLLPKILVLNAIRCILSKYPHIQYQFTTQKMREYLMWGTAAIWKVLDEEDRELLKLYFIQLIVELHLDELFDMVLSHEVLSDMFEDADEKYLKETISTEIILPELLIDSHWTYPDVKRNPKLETRLMEQTVISSYDYSDLADLLVKLAIKNPTKPMWRINFNWELPIPLQSVVTSISRGFLQDINYVLLAKSRELLLSKNWFYSYKFIKLLEAQVESNGGLNKLSKLLTWELMLIQISELLEDWPAPNIDRANLTQACENCLNSAESIIPRSEVMEQCILALVNMGHWEYFTGNDKRWNYFDLATELSMACQEIIKYKGAKKLGKFLWNFIVPVFSNTPTQVKRSATGVATVIQRDSPLTSNTKVQLVSFLGRLRDITTLNVVISMLAKLYNILKDDTAIEIQVDYILLWPSVLCNANSYNLGSVTEVLCDLLLQALKYYPNNVSWLRLYGDINFSNSNYEIALKYYLLSIVVSSDYFTIQIRYDDHMFKRMIKSCTSLGCHTQSAVLCQFLEEPDYTLAFRNLVDFKSCNDTVEAYYHCFWDMNMLEYLVHLHHKRGEFQRRKKAINTIGLLELNSNNNEEIQREAISLRKRTFLQAMYKEYVK